MSWTRPLLTLLLIGCAAPDEPVSAPPAPAPRATVVAPACAARRPPRFEVVDPGRSGAVALMREGERLLAVVADADERALHTVDVETMAEIAVTPLAAEPTHLLALDDGRIAVSHRRDGFVQIVEPTASWHLESRCRAHLGGEPIGIATHDDELLVTMGFDAELLRLDGGDLIVRGRIALPREPRAVVVTDRGEAAVSHMVGGMLSRVDLTDHTVRYEDLDVPRALGFARDDERHTGQGFSLVQVKRSDGSSRLFVPGASVSTGTTHEPVSTGYGSGPSGPRPVLPLVSVYHVEWERVLTKGAGTSRDDGERGCMLPRAVAAADDRLWVACLGVDAVLELDAEVAHPAMLEFRRFAVPSGPTGLRVDPASRRLIVWSHLAGQLSRVDLETEALISTTLARRDEPLLSAQQRRGRELFHSSVDARISGDHRACATCHPDGRDDGLVWGSPDGPRQTKFLAGNVVDTAPFGWFGEHEDLGAHLAQTFANLGGSGFSIDAEGAAEDYDALVAYLETLPAPHRPASAAAAVARGRALFESEEQGCAGCHRDGGTDGLAYDIGSGSPHERLVRFDTPSLRFIAGSAPYFHDGRFATLRGMLTAPDHRMAPSRDLSDDDLASLETYLRTL